jgi:hypothetical protein
LASALLVQPQWWADALPAILAEAERLQQRVVADVSGGDAVPAGVHAALTVDDASSPPPASPAGATEPPIHVLPLDVPGHRLMAVLTGGAP